MIDLHPEFLTRNGERQFVVLPYEEYVALQELLEDVEDIIELRNAKRDEGSAPTLAFDEVKRRLGLKA